jgi:hypothetical protein
MVIGGDGECRRRGRRVGGGFEVRGPRHVPVPVAKKTSQHHYYHHITRSPQRTFGIILLMTQ